MEHYNLAPNEAVLFKCDAANDVTVILTNINLVVIKEVKKLFSKEPPTVDVYPVDRIKIYNDIPQIKQSDCSVEIFLTSTEITVTFSSKGDARKFVNKILELVTGKTMSERAASKVKSAIGLVDDTLGIDTMGTAKNILENGVKNSVLGMFGKKASTIVGVAGKKASDPVEGDNTVEQLKKLKELLDMGIITQEEFDEKKQKILSSM